MNNSDLEADADVKNCSHRECFFFFFSFNLQRLFAGNHCHLG